MALTSSKPTAAGYGFVPRYTFNFQKGAWYPSARLMANTDFCETNPTSPFVSMPIDLYGKEPKQSKQVVDPQECNQDDALIVATRFTRCILNLSVVGFRALDRRQPCNCLINTRLLTRGLRHAYTEVTLGRSLIIADRVSCLRSVRAAARCDVHSSFVKPTPLRP